MIFPSKAILGTNCLFLILLSSACTVTNGIPDVGLTGTKVGVSTTLPILNGNGSSKDYLPECGKLPVPLHYYVFDLASGRLESTAVSTSCSSLGMTISAGDKEIWVVASGNITAFDSCIYLSEFRNTELTLEGESVLDELPLAGNVSQFVYPGGECEINVPLKHMTSRIVVREIRNVLSGPLSGLPLEVMAIFLINAAGNTLVTGEQCETISWLDASVPFGISCPYGESIAPRASLYYFPDARCRTKVVVKAGINGSVYYYPVEIKDAVGGYSYGLTLEITRPGTDNPDGEHFGKAESIAVEVEDFVGEDNEIIIRY